MNLLLKESSKPKATSSDLFGNQGSKATGSSDLFGNKESKSIPSSDLFSAEDSNMPSDHLFGTTEHKPIISKPFGVNDSKVPSSDLMRPKETISDTKESKKPASDYLFGTKEPKAPSSDLFGSKAMFGTSPDEPDDLFASLATNPSKTIPSKVKTPVKLFGSLSSNDNLAGDGDGSSSRLPAKEQVPVSKSPDEKDILDGLAESHKTKPIAPSVAVKTSNRIPPGWLPI